MKILILSKHEIPTLITVPDEQLENGIDAFLESVGYNTKEIMYEADQDAVPVSYFTYCFEDGMKQLKYSRTSRLKDNNIETDMKWLKYREDNELFNVLRSHAELTDNGSFIYKFEKKPVIDVIFMGKPTLVNVLNVIEQVNGVMTIAVQDCETQAEVTIFVSDLALGKANEIKKAIILDK